MNYYNRPLLEAYYSMYENILENNEIIIPVKTKEEKNKQLLRIANLKVQEYIKQGSKGNLYLNYTPIQQLPDNLKVGGSLYLNNTPIIQLPDNLEVGGLLDLAGTPIQQLPNNLKVGGELNLARTPIQQLPNNLKVGGHLNLNYTRIQLLPDNLKVGGDLKLLGSLIAKNIEYLKRLKKKFRIFV